MSEWISTKERMPTKQDADKQGNVLALFGDGSSVVVAWNAKLSSWTHWSPIPMPPKSHMPERIEYVKCDDDPDFYLYPDFDLWQGNTKNLHECQGYKRVEPDRSSK